MSVDQVDMGTHVLTQGQCPPIGRAGRPGCRRGTVSWGESIGGVMCSGRGGVPTRGRGPTGYEVDDGGRQAHSVGSVVDGMWGRPIPMDWRWTTTGGADGAAGCVRLSETLRGRGQ